MRTAAISVQEPAKPTKLTFEVGLVEGFLLTVEVVLE